MRKAFTVHDPNGVVSSSPEQPYSSRRAANGSIYPALRAGTKAARTDIASTKPATTMNVNGSFGRIPYIELVSKCAMSRLINDPIAIPRMVIFKLSPRTRFITLPRDAPTAILIPNSLVLSRTRNESTANSPTLVRITANAASPPRTDNPNLHGSRESLTIESIVSTYCTG